MDLVSSPQIKIKFKKNTFDIILSLNNYIYIC
jgi:hypothetical protein